MRDLCLIFGVLVEYEIKHRKIFRNEFQIEIKQLLPLFIIRLESIIFEVARKALL